jgi:transposase
MMKSVCSSSVDHAPSLLIWHYPNLLHGRDSSPAQRRARPSLDQARREQGAAQQQSGRKRLNINGAVNAQTMRVVTRTDDSVNAQSTIDLLKRIRRKHRKAQTIYVICDNARYYHAKLVREWLESVNIVMIYLPPYSPNLNLIERLWKYFHRQVLCNRYYGKFEDFRRACEEFFAKTVPKRKRKLRRLLRDNFEILGAAA